MCDNRSHQNTPSKENRDEEEQSKPVNNDEVKTENVMKEKEVQKGEDKKEADKNEEAYNEAAQSAHPDQQCNNEYYEDYNKELETIKDESKISQISTSGQDSIEDKSNISKENILSKKLSDGEKMEKNLERNKIAEKICIKENKKLLCIQTKETFELLDYINNKEKIKIVEIREIPKMTEGNVYNHHLPKSCNFWNFCSRINDCPKADNNEALNKINFKIIAHICTNENYRRRNYYYRNRPTYVNPIIDWPTFDNGDVLNEKDLENISKVCSNRDRNIGLTLNFNHNFISTNDTTSN